MLTNTVRQVKPWVSVLVALWAAAGVAAKEPAPTPSEVEKSRSSPSAAEPLIAPGPEGVVGDVNAADQGNERKVAAADAPAQRHDDEGD